MVRIGVLVLVGMLSLVWWIFSDGVVFFIGIVLRLSCLYVVWMVFKLVVCWLEVMCLMI